MGVTSEEEAQRILDEAKTFIGAKLNHARQMLEGARSWMQQIATSGPGEGDFRFKNMQSYFDAAYNDSEEVVKKSSELVNAGIISEEQDKEMFAETSGIRNRISEISVQALQAKQRGELGWFTKAVMDMGTLFTDFGRMTGITAGLKSVWKGVVGVVAAAGEAASWLPWILVGGAGIAIAGPAIIGGLARKKVKENPDMTGLLPLLILGGAGYAAYELLRPKGADKSVDASAQELADFFGALPRKLSSGEVQILTSLGTQVAADRAIGGTGAGASAQAATRIGGDAHGAFQSKILASKGLWLEETVTDEGATYTVRTKI
jgi:hypothetical protein